MNRFVLFLAIAFVIFQSSSVAAERGWIGETPVKEIFYARSNGNCGPSGGPCVMLKFGEGFTSCEWVSIAETSPHYKNIQSLALISLTAGKVLSLYGSNEHCKNSDLISINNVVIK